MKTHLKTYLRRNVRRMDVPVRTRRIQLSSIKPVAGLAERSVKKISASVGAQEELQYMLNRVQFPRKVLGKDKVFNLLKLKNLIQLCQHMKKWPTLARRSTLSPHRILQATPSVMSSVEAVSMNPGLPTTNLR